MACQPNSLRKEQAIFRRGSGKLVRRAAKFGSCDPAAPALTRRRIRSIDRHESSSEPMIPIRRGFNRSTQHLLILLDWEVAMEGNARTWFTPKQRAELWERWKSGQCVADIARALERRNKSGVYRVLAINGGIAPSPRRRAPTALKLEEREEISRGIAVARSIRQIAQGLGRSPSTVSREIRRNGGCSAYPASRADRYAWDRALRPKPCRLARHAGLRWRVAQKLALQWSPKQISGWLKRQFPADQGMQVSHETIYRSLFIQTRGVLKKELMAHLRTARQMRQAKGGTTKSG